MWTDSRAGIVAKADAIEERQQARTMALYREATIEADSQVGFCVVKNLSTGGAMIRTSMTLHLDQTVTLAMPSGRQATGRIRWQQSGLGGIAFDKPISPSWLLDRYAECEEGIACRKLPRVAMSVPVTVTDLAGQTIGTTCDISTHGMRLSSERALAIGPATIDLNGLGRIKVRILWCAKGQSGCVFDRAFSIKEITDLLGILELSRSDPMV